MRINIVNGVMRDSKIITFSDDITQFLRVVTTLLEYAAKKVGT